MIMYYGTYSINKWEGKFTFLRASINCTYSGLFSWDRGIKIFFSRELKIILF